MPTAPEPAAILFGEFIEGLRKDRGKSLRVTAYALGVSPQFYSEVEKGRRSALTADRLDMLRQYHGLSDAEASEMYNRAAQSRKNRDIAVPQDFSGYIVEREYAMAALRVAKELDAGEDDWRRFVDELRRRRGG